MNLYDIEVWYKDCTGNNAVAYYFVIADSEEEAIELVDFDIQQYDFYNPIIQIVKITIRTNMEV